MRCAPAAPKVTATLTPHTTQSSLQNELAGLEFIHALVETLDRYFENVVRFCLACLVAS